MPADEVRVAEMFYSIQGEGPYAGTPAVFLRLAGCNLLCGNPPDPTADADDLEAGEGAAWVCDSIPVWRQASETPTPHELVDDWAERGWLDHFARGAHLVVTGGEPTLSIHQPAVVAVVAELAQRGAQPVVEVETNGTQRLSLAFRTHVDHYNDSLNLANSGMAEARRLNPDAIDQYVALGERARFKFVTTGTIPDVAQIDALVSEYAIPDRQVSLMPAGQTRTQLEETYAPVAEACMARGWQFSPRLHVTAWDQATGV